MRIVYWFKRKVGTANKGFSFTATYEDTPEFIEWLKERNT